MQEEDPDPGRINRISSNNKIDQEKGGEGHNGSHEQDNKDHDNNQEKDGNNSKEATA
jgi:hypothetical protein